MARKQIWKAAEEMKHQNLSAAQDISRIVFGPFGRGQNSAAARKVQEYYQFFDHDGNISGYAGTTRKDSGLARYKQIGILSHFLAQKQSFMQWLRDMKPIHCIFVRVFDDTNIWVTPETGPAKLEDVDEDLSQADRQEVVEENEEEEGLFCSKKGRAGRRKVQALLGMLQWAVARRSESRRAATDAVEAVQLLAPSQVMPKANAATLLDRIGKWMLPGDAVPPAHLGGEALGSTLREIPFKVVLTCTDALSANVSALALEQQRALQRRQAGGDGTVTALVHAFCNHHQSALAGWCGDRPGSHG